MATAQYNAFPATYAPYASVYYISSQDANGNRLVEVFQQYYDGHVRIHDLAPSATRQ